jgi:hypothetical protein
MSLPSSADNSGWRRHLASVMSVRNITWTWSKPHMGLHNILLRHGCPPDKLDPNELSHQDFPYALNYWLAANTANHAQYISYLAIWIHTTAANNAFYIPNFIQGWFIWHLLLKICLLLCHVCLVVRTTPMQVRRPLVFLKVEVHVTVHQSRLGLLHVHWLQDRATFGKCLAMHRLSQTIFDLANIAFQI